MYRLMLGLDAQVVRGALLLPRLPGRTLSGMLQESGGITGRVELGLHLTVVELARLHACWTPHPWDGGLQRFSHADATIDNVLIDADRKQAHWIDFDTTHSPSLPAAARHADDLLTLLCGAATMLAPEHWPRLCQILLRSYQSKPVAAAMMDLIRHWDRHPAARRLAIPGFGDPQWQLLRQAALSTATG
jgi:hypothetical protein